jgi:histone arginine demethylase JMJD6
VSTDASDHLSLQRPSLLSIRDSPVYADLSFKIAEHLSYADDDVTPESAQGDSLTVPIREFYAQVAAGRPRAYLRDYYIGDRFGDLETVIYSTLALESWLLMLPGKARPRWFWLFIGADGTGSELHLDIMGSAAWNIVLEGEKHWRLMSPAVSVSRGLLSEDYLDLPEVSGKAEIVTVIQKPGDALMVPSGWLHEVRNTGLTTAVTGNYVNARNCRHMEHYLTTTGDSVTLRRLSELRQLAEARGESS